MLLKKNKITGNLAKYTTIAHAHDANYSITQLINKHDAYTVLFVPKLGLVVITFLNFTVLINIDIILVIFVTISFIVITAPNVFFYNYRR